MRRNLTNHLVLLTCTVKPNEQTRVKRHDTEVRLEDYKKSIIKWAKLSEKLNFRIAVVENSNSILMVMNALPKEYLGKIQFLQYPEDMEVSHRGISHGEFQLLKDYASGEANLLGFDYIWKVTGRLFVSNFAKIIPDESFLLTVNRFFFPRHLIDTRIVGFSKQTFIKFTMMNPNFSETIVETDHILRESFNRFTSLEDLLTYFAHRSEMVGVKVHRMKKIPLYEGTSASSNKKLDQKFIHTGIRIGNLLRPIAIKMLRGSAP